MTVIKRRERDAVLQSLQSGLVPRLGLHLIQVGRRAEVTAMLQDLERIEQGGSAFRIVVGRFGSGKTFFLNLVRALALRKHIVVVQADMTMERRLYSTGGQSRALYGELTRNLAIKSKPDGGALRNLCEGWISGIAHTVKSMGGDDSAVRTRIFDDLRDLQDYCGGFEFAEVLAKYYEGYASGNDVLQAAALRWLRAEYGTKTEARADLGVRRIIDDESFYDSLKLLAAFCVKAGYAGLLVNIDEMVVLSHRLPNSRARQANYEALLATMNDCIQGAVSNLGFVFAGTNECLEDRHRGLYSYEALRTRLVENQFAGRDVVDYSGPTIRLECLSPEDLFVLLKNIRHVHASGDPTDYAVPDEALVAVLKHASETLGAEYYKTPRDVVRGFVGLLNVLEQNPGKTWEELLGSNVVQLSRAAPSVEKEVALGIGMVDDSDDDLTTMRL